jgi:hypothetical protein
MEMMANRLAAAAKCVKGRPWGADIGKPRIYMPCGRKDARVYFDFPAHMDEELGKPTLRCYIAENGWHGGRWYNSQRAIILRGYSEQAAALKRWLAGDAGSSPAVLKKTGAKRVRAKANA